MRPRIGKYHALALVGRGGMADVHLAAARSMGGVSKLLVIKTLRTELVHDRDVVTMFLDEARLAARLDHPNIVQVYELGEEDGELYIAMEHLDGQPLDRFASRVSDAERVDEGLALHVAREALSALHHAHELCDLAGEPLFVVHRDVSPQNLFITYSGLVKLVDFGIAKGTDTLSETRVGTFKGKVAYMAPEQARGELVDRRADVFAMGVVLFELITGKRFWGTLTEPFIAARLVEGDIPRAREEAPELSPEAAAIVDAATRARREQRYASADEMRRDVERVLARFGARAFARELSERTSRAFATERLELDRFVSMQLVRLERGETITPRTSHPGSTFGTPTHASDVAHTRIANALENDPTTVATVPSGRLSIRPPANELVWPRYAAVATLLLGLAGTLVVARAHEEPARTGSAPRVAPAAIATDCASLDAPVVRLSGDIDEDETLTCDKLYRLEHLVFVREGATLTIEPGTRILGDSESGGALIISPGGKIHAEGTRTKPIVFTSERSAETRAAGDWGGVILLGRAPINLRARTGAGRRGQVEGILERGEYGGDDPEDSSGVLRYVRIEYGGTRLGPNNEINGLTLAGVGRGTRIDHVQVKRTKDDCFELFGGTVDLRHLICDAPGDDAFDWDEGYTGRMQFLLYRDDVSGDGNNGFEGDNDAEGSTNTPVSAPFVSNVTLCGAGARHETYAIMLRRGTRGTVVNVVASGFRALVDVRDRFASPSVEAFAVLGAALPLGLVERDEPGFPTNDDHGFDEVAWLSQLAPEAPLERERCAEGAGIASERALPEDGFFDTSARFLGAFRDASDTWHEEPWTAPFP